MSMFGFDLWDVIGWSWVVFITGGAVWYYFGRQAEGLDVTADDKLWMYLAPLSALPILAFGWWQKSKCKPIYDRWVMQHGTDPEQWPGLYGRK